MKTTESLPELFFEFHGLCLLNGPFAALLLQRLRNTSKPFDELTIGQVRQIVLTAQGDYNTAAEAENTDWPAICANAAAELATLEQAA